MGRIISAYIKGFAQLSDPQTRAVVLTAIGLSAAIFAGLLVLVWLTLGSTVLFTLGWLEGLVDFLGGFATLVLTWFLFPAVVTAIGALLLDKVVEAVESRHFPDLPMAPGLSVAESIGPALKFLGVTVGLNLLTLPLLLTPLFPFVYYALNGYLLSREYFEMVALRRVGAADADGMRRRWKMPLFVAGVGFAFMLTVPILNVIAPVIATATMVHLFEAWRGQDGVRDKSSSPKGHAGGEVTPRPRGSGVAER